MLDTWSWLIFALVLGTFLAIDLFFVQRRHGAMRTRTALVWVIVWVSLGIPVGPGAGLRLPQ